MLWIGNCQLINFCLLVLWLKPSLIFFLLLDSKEPILSVPVKGPKVTAALWGPLDQFIITGHENGDLCQWDTKVWYGLYWLTSLPKFCVFCNVQFWPSDGKLSQCGKKYNFPKQSLVTFICFLLCYCIVKAIHFILYLFTDIINKLKMLGEHSK